MDKEIIAGREAQHQTSQGGTKQHTNRVIERQRRHKYK